MHTRGAGNVVAGLRDTHSFAELSPAPLSSLQLVLSTVKLLDNSIFIISVSGLVHANVYLVSILVYFL